MSAKMSRLSLLLLSAISVILSSCSTDFEMNAPYKQTTVVYGLLNQNDPVQTIRVQHSFLGKGNALDMAKEKDSTYFPPNRITVQIKKFLDNNEVGAVTLVEERTNTPSGTFASDSVILYKTRLADSSFFDASTTDPNARKFYEYRLVVTDNATGKVVTAKTNLISDFAIDWLAQTVSFKTSSGYSQPVVTWKSPTFGRVTNMAMRFYYVNFDAVTLQRVDTAFIEIPFGNQVIGDLNGGKQLTQKVEGEQFYNIVKDSLTARDLRNPGRYVRYINFFSSSPTATPSENVWFTFTFNFGNDDLNTYINLNAPSTGLVQERPLFTNVENGVGLFGARTSKTIKKKIEKLTNEELANGAITNGLFRNCLAGDLSCQ